MSVGMIILIILVIVLLGGFSGLGGGPFYGTGRFAAPHRFPASGRKLHENFVQMSRRRAGSGRSPARVRPAKDRIDLAGA